MVNRNRFKGLDLIDRVLDELWTEVRDIVQETGIKTIPKKKKCKKAKWLSEEAVWRRQWHPTPALLPGKSHGRRSLVGCSPWGREESHKEAGSRVFSGALFVIAKN